MHKILLFAFFITLVNSTFAQETESSNYPVAVSSASFEKVIGTKNGRLLMLIEERDQYFIAEYDTVSMAEKAKYPIAAEKEVGISKYLAGVFMIGSNIKVIYRQYVILTKAHTLNVYDCDFNGLINSSKKEYSIKDWDKDDFVFFTMNENKDCLLFGRTSKNLKNTEITFESFLINEHSETLQTLTLTEHIEKKGDFVQSSVAINNQHEIFTYAFHNTFNKSDKKFHSQVYLKMYNASKKEPISSSSFEIPVGYSCAELLLKEVGNRSVLTGIYQNYTKKRVNGYLGLFRVLVENGKLGTPVYTKYSEATRLKTIQGADITEGVSVRPFYTLHDYLVDSKGNVYIIQERQTINTEGKFYYGSILISKFDTNGNLVWDNLIPKSQFFSLKVVSNPALYILPPALTILAYYTITRTDEGYLSFKATLVNDEIQLLFNDIKENENKQGFTERQPYTNPEKGIPYVATVKSDGTFSYKCREDLKPSGEPFVLQNGYYLNGSYILISKDRKRGNLLSKVRF